MFNMQINTIVVTEDCRRLTRLNPYYAWQYVKNNNGTIFFRTEDKPQIEEKIVFVGGNLVEARIKYNRKIVDPDVVIDDVELFKEQLMSSIFH